jgi:hypothetical protein
MNMHFPESWDVIQSISVEACTTRVGTKIRKSCGNKKKAATFSEKVFDVNENFTSNTDFCESFQRNKFNFSFNKLCVCFCKIFLISAKVERLFLQKCEDENCRFKAIGKALLPLLFLSPGARKFLMLTKISQEIQIFAKAFRGISFYTLFFI